MNKLISDIKKILGIYNDSFDGIIEAFIEAGKKDLEQVGIDPTKIQLSDSLIYSALVSFVLSMTDNYEYKEMSANAYALQKDQLRHYTNYQR